MIHPDLAVAHVSDVVGRGVVALRPIPKGTIVWARDALDASWPLASVLTWPDVWRPILSHTALRVRDEVWQPWDHARLMNHACDPNAAGTEFGFEVALRDIQAGEQVTNDYADCALPFETPFACTCGHVRCRGSKLFTATPDERQTLSQRFVAARAAMRDVPQPLMQLLERDLASLD